MTQPIGEKAAVEASDYTMSYVCRAMVERNRDGEDGAQPGLSPETLERVVAAVFRKSRESGFATVRLEELAREANLSATLLDKAVGGKCGLMTMMLHEVAEAIVAVLGRPPEAIGRDPVAHLGWFMTTHLALSEAMGDWFVFIFMEARSLPAPQRAMAVEIEEATDIYLAEILDAGRAAGCLRPDDPELMPLLIKPLLRDWYLKRAKYHRRGITPDRYAREVKRMVMAACGAASGAP
ncbi:TetR/AcrR family transcriptional regulator [Salinihabitans flavidus]|uniref:TetR/AcrR family transcriptional regulator n=1 Tax=Salinihabitans flavidus TaxID=569882 RepID=UPI0011136B5B|nr:TetR/AcrR family transcriptional regulator [Salinihabitans flavidus]